MTKPNDKKTLTVCVVTFNQSQYINQCLESILNQETDFDFDVIVGDDCSTDETCALVEIFIKKYPNRIRLFNNKSNLGPSENLVLTCKRAATDFIAHCDGDDYWLPGKLQTQVDILTAKPNISGVFTNAVANKKPINATSDRLVDISSEIKNIFTRSPFIRSSFVERNFDIEKTERYLSMDGQIFDFELYWLHHFHTKLYILGDVYVNYNTQSSGVSRRVDILDKYSLALARMKRFGLSRKLHTAMALNLKVARYLINPDSSNKISIWNYLVSGGRSPLQLAKITMPKKLLIKYRKIRSMFVN